MASKWDNTCEHCGHPYLDTENEYTRPSVVFCLKCEDNATFCGRCRRRNLAVARRRKATKGERDDYFVCVECMPIVEF